MDITQAVPNKTIGLFSVKEMVKEVKSGNIHVIIGWFEEKKENLNKIAMVYADTDQIRFIFERTVESIFKNIKQFKTDGDIDMWMMSLFIDECRRNVKSNFNDTDGSDEELLIKLRKIEGIGRDIIAIKYYGGYTLYEISKILGTDLDRVRYEGYAALRELGMHHTQG